MRTNRIRVSLKPSNNALDVRYDGVHSFDIVEGNKELILVTPAGKEIARLSVQTMSRDVKDEDGEYHTKPSKNFFLCFDAKENSGSRNQAAAWAEDIGAEIPA